VVTKTLVREDIDGGFGLVQRLRDKGVDFCAALWLYQPETERWRLLVASEEVDSQGPRAAYSRIFNILKDMPEGVRPSAEDIAVVSPSDTLIQLLGSALSTGPAIGRVRFTGNSINNVFVDDALVYYLNLRQGR
jgi:hypothetical protein